MAINNPSLCHDPYGEMYTFFTDGTAESHLGRWDPVTAFTQPVADSPIAATMNSHGRITITYLAANGDRLEKHSDQDGVSGSWLPV